MLRMFRALIAQQLRFGQVVVTPALLPLGKSPTNNTLMLCGKNCPPDSFFSQSPTTRGFESCSSSQTKKHLSEVLFSLWRQRRDCLLRMFRALIAQQLRFGQVVVTPALLPLGKSPTNNTLMLCGKNCPPDSFFSQSPTTRGFESCSSSQTKEHLSEVLFSLWRQRRDSNPLPTV